MITQSEFFTWLHAADFITYPTINAQPASKGLMEVETPVTKK